MPVGDEVKAFVIGIGLEFDPVLEGAEVVADVETSGGAHAGDDSIDCAGQFIKPRWLIGLWRRCTVISDQLSGSKRCGDFWLGS